jgi:hypothetical protein
MALGLLRDLSSRERANDVFADRSALGNATYLLDLGVEQ